MELAEAEYMVRASGYLKTLDDFRNIPLAATDAGVAVHLGDVAHVQDVYKRQLQVRSLCVMPGRA